MSQPARKHLVGAVYDADTNGFFMDPAYKKWIEEGTEGFPNQPAAKRELLRFMEELHVKQLQAAERQKLRAKEPITP